jgi:superfamily II RNA helicase
MTTFVWKVTFVSSLNKVVKKRRFQIPDWVKTEKKIEKKKCLPYKNWIVKKRDCERAVAKSKKLQKTDVQNFDETLDSKKPVACIINILQS